jgi:hypothetical protein
MRGENLNLVKIRNNLLRLVNLPRHYPTEGATPQRERAAGRLTPPTVLRHRKIRRPTDELGLTTSRDITRSCGGYLRHAVEYADQNERDYRAFIKAIREERLQVITEV